MIKNVLLINPCSEQFGGLLARYMKVGIPVAVGILAAYLKKFGFKDEQLYVNLERHMKCGIRKCGHCMIRGKYVCEDGPVFRYDEVKEDG